LFHDTAWQLLMLEAVARLLHELAGARILDTTDLGNPAAPVLRVTLDNHYDRVGRTVIAKMRRRSGAGWNTWEDAELG
jgi:hypothetical protein